MESLNKVGIMGGTFNPVHNGHIALAQCAYETLSLDKVLFMPSGKSYMKNDVLDAEHRIAMIERAIAPYPYFELSNIEVNRAGNTYTYETLELLKQQHPQIRYYFIMGADSLFHIETWKNPEVIFSLSTLVCSVRDEYHMEELENKRDELIRKGADVILLQMPKIDISSSDIRNRVARGLTINEFVPDSVSRYILQEHLYEEDKEIS